MLILLECLPMSDCLLISLCKSLVPVCPLLTPGSCAVGEGQAAVTGGRIWFRGCGLPVPPQVPDSPALRPRPSPAALASGQATPTYNGRAPPLIHPLRLS